MKRRHVGIVGGGAAGFFAAITCAENAPETTVTVFERGAQFLSKVRISGGGRCNVTHSQFDVGTLSGYYPRGGSALRSAFRTFQPRDTVEWFASRGVELKTEPDGRMFPVSDSSETIVNCLLDAARSAGVELVPNCAVERVSRLETGQFRLDLSIHEQIESDCLMLATGGCRSAATGQLALSLGHSLKNPVPSLFTFQVNAPWLRDLSGISLQTAALSLPELQLREQGPLLVTHSGLSGPAVLKLSAWGARDLHELNYQTLLRVNWLPRFTFEEILKECQTLRSSQPAKLIVNVPIRPLPARLWESLVLESGVPRETRWAELSRAELHKLALQITDTKLQIQGKSLNQDEFVTCGGVALNEVDFRTMESRICPGLYFGGELLDIDGLTGGFNFQAAWTTGWIAGHAMARSSRG